MFSKPLNKVTFFTCLFILLCIFSSAQPSRPRSFSFKGDEYATYSLPRPDDFVKPQMFAKKGIRQEMVYLVYKKRKQMDSELVVAEYFDSLGNCIEKHTYDSSKPVSVTTFTYANNLLTIKRSVINSGFYNDIVTTYSYDTAGNKTQEKIYSKRYGDSINPYEIRMQKTFQYDSTNHLLSVFTSKDGIEYLSEKCTYSNDTLRMIENFSAKSKLPSTDYYDYDTKKSKTMIYNDKKRRDLREELLYDSSGNLIEDIDHEVFGASKTVIYDATTIFYEYNEGLLTGETFHPKYDDEINYKYYYYNNAQ